MTLDTPLSLSQDIAYGRPIIRAALFDLQPDYGGAERHVLLLARGLRDRGQDVRIFCHPAGRLREEARAEGIATVALEAHGQTDMSVLPRLIGLLRAEAPHLVHLHTPRDYVLGALAAWFVKTPAVITRHMLLPVSPLMRRIYGRAAGVICPSRAVRANLQAGGVPAKRLELIPGAIDTREFVRASGDAHGGAFRCQLALDDGSILVGVVGRLVAGKGHSYLLRALAALPASPCPIKLVIVGTGPEEGALRAEADSLGVAALTSFVGFRSDVADVMAAMDIVVLPSTVAEVMPLTVMEAMTVGRPVIAARVGGVPEIVVEEVTGLLVPPGDSEALAAAMNRLAQDAELRDRLGREGQEVAARCFDLARMAEETESVYRKFTALTKGARKAS